MRIMAWIKTIAHEAHGAEAHYWEVISVYYEHKRQLSILEVGGWVNAEAYNNGLSPLLTKIWEIPSGLAPQLATGAVQFVSGFAKSQPEFEGWANVA